MADEKVYGKPVFGTSTFSKRLVAASVMTFDATLNFITYEGGIPIFMDIEYDIWNTDLVALEKTFEVYSEIKVVINTYFNGRARLLRMP